MRHLVTLILLFTSALLMGQVRPDQFPEELNPSDVNFEIYSQFNGVNSKTKPSSLAPLYGAKIVFTPIAYVPTSTGNSMNYNQFVEDPNGDQWFIDIDGKGLNLSANLSGDTDTRLEYKRTFGAPDTIVLNRINALTSAVLDSIFIPLTASGGSDNLGNHTATQELDMNNNKITGLPNATLADEAVNKAQLDAGDNDDINSGDAAGGDMGGTYPDPTVTGIQGRPVAATAPTSGQALKWDGSQWAPDDDATASGGAADGVVDGAAFSGTTTKTLTLARTEGLSDLTATFTDNVDDADNNVGNELQNLVLSGDLLQITGGNGLSLQGVDHRVDSLRYINEDSLHLYQTKRSTGEVVDSLPFKILPSMKIIKDGSSIGFYYNHGLPNATGWILYNSGSISFVANNSLTFSITDDAVQFPPNSSDPSGYPDGTMYYNFNLNKFRCKEDGVWKDCDTSTGGGSGGGSLTVLEVASLPGTPNDSTIYVVTADNQISAYWQWINANWVSLGYVSEITGKFSKDLPQNVVMNGDSRVSSNSSGGGADTSENVHIVTYPALTFQNHTDDDVKENTPGWRAIKKLTGGEKLGILCHDGNPLKRLNEFWDAQGDTLFGVGLDFKEKFNACNFSDANPIRLWGVCWGSNHFTAEERDSLYSQFPKYINWIRKQPGYVKGYTKIPVLAILSTGTVGQANKYWWWYNDFFQRMCYENDDMYFVDLRGLEVGTSDFVHLDSINKGLMGDRIADYYFKAAYSNSEPDHNQLIIYNHGVDTAINFNSCKDCDVLIKGISTNDSLLNLPFRGLSGDEFNFKLRKEGVGAIVFSVDSTFNIYNSAHQRVQRIAWRGNYPLHATYRTDSLIFETPGYIDTQAGSMGTGAINVPLTFDDQPLDNFVQNTCYGNPCYTPTSTVDRFELADEQLIDTTPWYIIDIPTINSDTIVTTWFGFGNNVIDEIQTSWEYALRINAFNNVLASSSVDGNTGLGITLSPGDKLRIGTASYNVGGSTIIIQHSTDGGETWSTVHTFATQAVGTGWRANFAVSGGLTQTIFNPRMSNGNLGGGGTPDIDYLIFPAFDKVDFEQTITSLSRGSFHQDGASNSTTGSTTYINVPTGWSGHDVGSLQDFTHSAGALTYTGTNTKVFKYACTVTATSNGTAELVYITGSDNGTALDAHEMWGSSSGAGRPFNIAVQGEVTLANNEVFRPMIKTNTTTEFIIHAVGCQIEEVD